MWCTLCRAPILVNASKGSNDKLAVLSQLSADDIAHLSSAHGFCYAHEAVALEYVPINEEMGLLAEGKKHNALMTIYSQKLSPTRDNWLLHTACLNILLQETGLTEENEETLQKRALFEVRSEIGRDGEFVGMADANNRHLQYAVSLKNRPLMRRLDWADGKADPWNFRDPNSNEQNRNRVLQSARLVQRVRLAAGDASPQATHRYLALRREMLTQEQLLHSQDGERTVRDGPMLIMPRGQYAALIVKDGRADDESCAIAMAKLYPPV